MAATPDKIEKIGDESLRLFWEDGHETVFPFRLLRQICPCAVCKDEWTGARLVDPDSVPADLGAESADLVGSYALQFRFSDGHSTGVFTFDMLRRECPCSKCRK